MDVIDTEVGPGPYATAEELGLMVGFPPAPEQRVTRANWLFPPYNRWAFQHLTDLIPSAPVHRGTGPVRPLPGKPTDHGEIAALPVTDHTGATRPLEEMLTRTWHDALVVLHRGELAFERYANAMTRSSLHMLASCTKSFTGVLALMAIDDGRLDPDQPTTRLLPELAGSGWEDTTVGQVLDMTVSLVWDELTWLENDPDPSDLDAPFLGFLRAAGSWVDERHDPGHGLWDYLPTLQRDGEHGRQFTYFTPATEVLGWTLTRLHGRPYAQLLSERLWSRLGAEHDARVGLDPIGTAISGGGLCTTARDLARFGQMLLDGGTFNDELVVSPHVIAQLRGGGDPEAFARSPEVGHMEGWSYRGQWWIPPLESKTISAWGVAGQILYVDYANEVVIARFASAPNTIDPNRDNDEWAICEALAGYFGAH